MKKSKGNSGSSGALIPVQLPQAIPFSSVPIQTSVIETQRSGFKPVTALSFPLTVLDFIVRVDSYYIDLSKVELQLNWEILDADSKALAKTNVKDGIINDLPSNAINRLEFKIQDVETQMCCDNYVVRNLFLRYSNQNNEAAETVCQTDVFAKDTAGQTNTAGTANAGWAARRKAFIHSEHGGKEVTTITKLHLDMSSGSKFLCNGLTLRCRIVFHSDAFVMFNAPATAATATTAAGVDWALTKFKVNDATLFVTTVSLNPDLMLDNERRLAAGYNMTDTIRRIDVRTFLTPSTGKRISLSNAIIGSIPNLIFVGLLDSAAYSGSHGSNPLTLYHLSVKQVTLHISQSCIILGPVDHTAPRGYVPFYHAYINAMSYRRNERPMISYDEFISGYFIMAFDLTADNQAMSGNHISVPLEGDVRIEIELGENLTKNYIVAVLSEYNGVYECNRNRMVRIE